GLGVGLFFFSSRRRHTRFSRDWSSDVCSSDLAPKAEAPGASAPRMVVGHALRSPRCDRIFFKTFDIRKCRKYDPASTCARRCGVDGGRSAAKTLLSQKRAGTSRFPISLWDLAENEHSIALIESFLAANKPVALVCHAPGVLRHAKKPDGRPLI